MTEKHRCQSLSWSGIWSYECGKNANHEHDGNWYCKTHHPPTMAAIQAARNQAWKEKNREESAARLLVMAEQKEAERRADCYPDLLNALSSLHARLTECVEQPIFVSDAYDSFYQEVVSAALAKAKQ